MTERRVGIRFKVAVEVYVSSAWTETHTMQQIEKQARIDAEGVLRKALAGSAQDGQNVSVIGELGYEFTLARETK